MRQLNRGIIDYLCFTAEAANSTIRLDKVGSPNAVSLEVSSDGNLWSVYGWNEGTGDVITLSNVGDKVYWRARANNVTFSTSNADRYQFKSSSGTKLNCTGSLLSLLNSRLNVHVLPDWCFYGLFMYTNVITTLPAIPSVSMGLGSMYRTFEGLTSATGVAIVPNITTRYQSVRATYKGTGITHAYIDLQNIINSSVLRFIFQSCPSLQEIVWTAPTWPSNGTYSWVDGVAASGNFFLPKGCPKIYSKSFIPHGWNVNEIDDRPLCFEAVEDNSRIALKKIGEPYEIELETSFNDGIWQPYKITGSQGVIITLNTGDTLKWRTPKRSTQVLSKDPSNKYNFIIAGKVKASGNLCSLMRYKGCVAEIPDLGLTELFINANGLISPPDIYARKIGNGSISQLFRNTSITTFPKFNVDSISNIEISNSQICDNTKITEVDIPKGLLTYKVNYLFRNCSTINRIGVHFTSWGNTYQWLIGIGVTDGTFICPKGLDISTRDASHIPVGWTVKRWYEVVAEQYPTTIAQMMSDYPALEDVVDTYPNVAPILAQYPNLVHSLVDTGYTTYMILGNDTWETDVYPHLYMQMDLYYNKVNSDDAFIVGSKTSNNFGLLLMEHGSTPYTKIGFGDVTLTSDSTICGETGKHTLIISKDDITFDGTAKTDTDGVKKGSFDTDDNVRMPDKIYIKGSSNCQSRLYNVKLSEYDNLTHNYVPVADGIFADIADLDNVKILQTDSLSSSQCVVEELDYLAFTAVEGGATITLSKVGAPYEIELQYSTDKCSWNDYTWNAYNTGLAITLTEVGDHIFFKAKTRNENFSKDYTSNYYKFAVTNRCLVSGNIMSLLDSKMERVDVPECAFGRLFRDISTCEFNVKLPATTLASNCYNRMFSNNSLATAPELPATTLASGCYAYMFYNCPNLNNVKVGFKTWNNTYTDSWLSGVAQSGTFYCPDELDNPSPGVSTVPAGWTIVRPSDENN